MTIGLVTDSSSQITAALIERYDIEVVPMTVTIDGVEHREGVDLDADEFYAAFGPGMTPEISTSQPSPGDFIDAYQRVADRGYDKIVSVHISEAMSGTVASAGVAAQSAPVPVRVVDTGSASFGVAVCAWASGVAIGRGANLDDIQRRIENLVPRIATAFMVGVPLLTERGGRADEIDVDFDDDGIPVLAMADGNLEVLERVTTVGDTIDVMSTYAHGWGERCHRRDRHRRRAEPNPVGTAGTCAVRARRHRRRDPLPHRPERGSSHRAGHVRPVRVPDDQVSGRIGQIGQVVPAVSRAATWSSC